MLFSFKWLMELCPAAGDLDAAAAALTSRGLTVDAVDPKDGNPVLDIDVPANRPDCLGHLGIARELSAAFGVPLSPPDLPSDPSGRTVSEEIEIHIDDPALCSRYTAGIVRDLTVGPSPAWVVGRLEACGLRSVNNVVDASNLVLLELGQPIHFFDLALLRPKRRREIHVRGANDGESLVTLDGETRRLEPGMAVIADGERAVALAGVIGGAATEISTSTREVLVEAARFDPISVRRTSRRLGIQTDASFRFERGGDPDGPLAAQRLAARLLGELAGGVPAPGRTDVYPAPVEPRTMTLRRSEVERLLGFAPEEEETREALERLQLSPQTDHQGGFRVRVPSWRDDLGREADLVEEIARHVGYDRIPGGFSTTQPDPAVRNPESRLEDRARDLLADLGFREGLGYSMIARGEDERYVDPARPDAIELVNPIAEPLNVLRRSILPGLLRAADLNLRRGTRDVRLFEVGRVFLPRGASELPEEPLRVGVAWSGAGEASHWSRTTRTVDLYDLAGLSEHLLSELRPGQTWHAEPSPLSAFHPGQSIQWFGPGRALLAWAGALHPDLQGDYDHPVFLLEMDLGELARLPRKTAVGAAIPRVPAVVRDLSLVLTGDVDYATLLVSLTEVAAPAPVSFEALDRYEGPPLADGQTSLTIRVTLQPLNETLTDEQSESYRQALVDRLAQSLSIRMRG